MDWGAIFGALSFLAMLFAGFVGYFTKAKFAEFKEKQDEKLKEEKAKYDSKLKELEAKLEATKDKFEQEYLKRREFEEFKKDIHREFELNRDNIKTNVTRKLSDLDSKLDLLLNNKG